MKIRHQLCVLRGENRETLRYLKRHIMQVMHSVIKKHIIGKNPQTRDITEETNKYLVIFREENTNKFEICVIKTHKMM